MHNGQAYRNNMYQRRRKDVIQSERGIKNDKGIGTTNFTNERRLFDVRREKIAPSNRKWFNASDVSKMNAYRPTVRYAPVFRDYVDSVFRATTLDRNQIIRAALFAAAYSERFYSILKQYQKKDVPLPSPPWQLEQKELWMEQTPRREGEIPKVFRPSSEGIKIRIG